MIRGRRSCCCAALGAKRQGWYKQLQVLGGRFRTLALDYRDVGDSSAAGEPYTIRMLADDVYALAGELGVERASLVPIENGRHLAASIPGARLIVYEDVGHIPEVECFEQFNDDLLAFLS